MLSLPAGVGFANFCSFVGAFLARIRELRVVRREGGRGSGMVLLQFWDAETTRDFFANYNDTPVSFQPALCEHALEQLAMMTHIVQVLLADADKHCAAT